jgi:hypothetical protein
MISFETRLLKKIRSPNGWLAISCFVSVAPAVFYFRALHSSMRGMCGSAVWAQSRLIPNHH